MQNHCTFIDVITNCVVFLLCLIYYICLPKQATNFMIKVKYRKIILVQTLNIYSLLTLKNNNILLTHIFHKTSARHFCNLSEYLIRIFEKHFCFRCHQLFFTF